MDSERFAALTRAISIMVSRRTVAGALGLSTAGLAGWIEARKKRKKRKKKRKNKHKCGKPGGQPVKGKCCKGTVLVDGRCQRCDVCASGCAFSSVQAAIDAAAAGDTIAICPGTYRGNLTISTPLRLIGAGDGNSPSDTIVLGSGIYSVVFIQSIVSLEKLRITGGSTVSGGGGGGGGIFNYGAGAVELVSCTVSGNETSYGGGIYNFLGTLTLRNSTVSDNEAGISGGGIFNQGTLILIASEIHGNASAGGGGIYNYIDHTITADAASHIRANTVTSVGGGIYNDSGGTVTLASSAIVTDNTPDNCVGQAVPNCID